jgi:chromosome segregation ATPase
MTRTRYLAWRIGQTFGISMTGRHASHAATEMHLLREAEEVLGRLCWEDAEDIEELSVEYWNLRKLTKKFDDLFGRINNANVTLQQSHVQRASLLELVVDSTKDLVAERAELVEKAERLGAEREAILGEARAVKRRHDGIKAKLEVLAGEGGDSASEVDASKEELLNLKQRFKALRDRRDALAERVKTFDQEIQELDERIETRRAEMRDEAFGSYQNIGKANRDISQSRAELGILDGEMVTLFAEVGRYVSVNYLHPTCRKAVRRHRSLISQMQALRVSITLNNRLAGREPVTSG